MTKLDLPADEPTNDFKPFYGVQKGITKDAKINETLKDKNGNTFYKVQFDVSYTGTDDKEKTTRCFGILPFDWGSSKPFGQFYDIIGTDYKKLLADFEKETNEKSICVKIGAQREFVNYEPVGAVKGYNGHVSLGIVGFAAFNRAATAWTLEDEAREVAAYEEFKSYSNESPQEVDPNFGEPDPEIDTPESIDKDNF